MWWWGESVTGVSRVYIKTIGIRCSDKLMSLQTGIDKHLFYIGHFIQT